MGDVYVDVEHGSGEAALADAVDEALNLRRYRRGATAADLASELGAPLEDVEAVLQRRAERSPRPAAA